MVRFLRCSALMVMALLAAACAAPGPRAPEPERVPEPVPAPMPVLPPLTEPPLPPVVVEPPAPSGPPIRRGSGYFQNDGPGDRSVAELERVPDATPRRETLKTAANRPYTVMGRRYEPMTRLQPFRQRGSASWYGRQFHGRRTAIGERYDMYAMSAAHPTLPLPSYARVTNVRNGRVVVVRVNDRGPFLGGRAIDLSHAAAVRLGFHDRGHVEVEISLITRFDEDGAVPVAAAGD